MLLSVPLAWKVLRSADTRPDASSARGPVRHPLACGLGGAWPWCLPGAVQPTLGLGSEPLSAPRAWKSSRTQALCPAQMSTGGGQPSARLSAHCHGGRKQLQEGTFCPFGCCLAAPPRPGRHSICRASAAGRLCVEQGLSPQPGCPCTVLSGGCGEMSKVVSVQWPARPLAHSGHCRTRSVLPSLG